LVDSPGGQVDGTASFANAIKSFSKPMIGYVDDGMAASAAMWMISAADEVYASLEQDQVGSIGVYTSIADWNAYFEKQGLKVLDIYAPQSTDKNKGYYDALKGNEDLIKEELSVIAANFISAVKQNRGDVTTANQSAWDSGKMFYAKDATKIGLIDGVKSFDQVISKAAWLGKRKKY
jgi:protease-4